MTGFPISMTVLALELALLVYAQRVVQPLDRWSARVLSAVAGLSVAFHGASFVLLLATVLYVQLDPERMVELTGTPAFVIAGLVTLATGPVLDVATAATVGWVTVRLARRVPQDPDRSWET